MSGGALALLTDGFGAGLNAAAKEALGLASRIGAEAGTGFDVAVIGEASGSTLAEIGERGAGRVFTVPAVSASSDALVALAEAAVAASGARFIVVNRGAYALDIVPRLAARLKGGSVMGVTEASLEGGDLKVTAAIYGGAARGAFRFKGPGPRVITPAPGAAEAPAPQPGRVAEVIPVAAPAISDRVRVVEPLRAPEGPRLEDAQVVVSGGRGLRDGKNYALVRELAAALSGLPGASRAIVDDGWASPTEQVGLTGKIVTPQLYVAAGISGASQHMAGCSNSKVLVAVNTDPEAPIFKYAKLGIVDDCLAILPELIRLARGSG